MSFRRTLRPGTATKNYTSVSVTPVLSSPTATADGANAGVGTVSTTVGNGILYWVVTSTATQPTAAQIKAGLNEVGTAAREAKSQTVSNVGTYTVYALLLTGAQTSYWHYMQENNEAQQSNVVTSSSFTTAAAPATGWRTVKLGGGGWHTGIDISADGKMVCRVDIGGAYAWDYGSSTWSQLINSSSADWSAFGLYGVYDIRIAPSATSTLYMNYFGYMWKSTDYGATWTQQSGWTRHAVNLDNSYGVNSRVRMNHGPHIAVNPSDATLVLAGTVSEGVRKTTNGGTTWADISGIITTSSGADYGNGYSIIWVSATEALICSWGTGVYRSTNSGSSFSITSSGPTSVKDWSLSANGTVWAVDSGGRIWKIVAGTWTENSYINSDSHTIACHPTDANKILVLGTGGYVGESTTDGGANWTALPQANVTLNTTDPTQPLWHTNANEIYLSAGACRFNPIDNYLYFSNGIGIFRCLTANCFGGTVAFESASAGTETLQGNQGGVSTVNGTVVLGNYDRSFWNIRNPEKYQANPYPSQTRALIIYGNCVTAAVSDPSYLFANCAYNGHFYGYSTDGGFTWTAFSTLPGTIASGFTFGGYWASSTPDNIVWCPTSGYSPYYTTDRGVTWNQINNISGVPNVFSQRTSSGDPVSGFCQAYYDNGRVIIADSVTANKFYMYNWQSGYLYISTNSGVTWSQGANGLAGTSGAQICAVPGNAGHLVMTGSFYAGYPLKRSTDGGVTFSTVSDFTFTWSVSAGKTIGSYPTIFVVGIRGGVKGCYMSTDFDQPLPNWTLVGATSTPGGHVGLINSCVGDMGIAGKVWVANSFQGWQYYQP